MFENGLLTRASCHRRSSLQLHSIRWHSKGARSSITPARSAILPSTLLNASAWEALRNHPDQSLARYNTGSLGHPALQIASTLLNARAWEEALRNHPDQSLARYIINSLSEGSRVGFDRSHALVSAKRSLPSATEQSEALREEVLFGKVLVRFLPSSARHINCVGVSPKGHTLGKWHFIADLAHPPTASADGPGVMLICVKQVAAMLCRLGRGVLLSKVDTDSAY